MEIEKQKQSNDKEGEKEEYRVAHTTHHFIDITKCKSAKNDGNLFGDVIKAKEGCMIGGFGKHFGIGGTRKRLTAAHNKSDYRSNHQESGHLGSKIDG